MLTSASRRFERTNDYRMGKDLPTRPRTKDRIRVVRPTGVSDVSAALEARKENARRKLSSAA